MKHLSAIFTKYLIKKAMISEEDSDVYLYGFQTFLELALNILCSVIISILTQMEFECLVFFLIFIPLRSYVGGLHMEHYVPCLLLSCSTLLCTLISVKYIAVPAALSYLIYAVSFGIILLAGPVNHPNRPVNTEEHLLFEKKKAICLVLSLLASIFFIAMNLKKYIFLEALVFLLLAVTQVIGKIKYRLVS